MTIDEAIESQESLRAWLTETLTERRPDWSETEVLSIVDFTMVNVPDSQWARESFLSGYAEAEQARLAAWTGKVNASELPT